MALVRNTPSESFEERENAGVYLCPCSMTEMIERLSSEESVA